MMVPYPPEKILTRETTAPLKQPSTCQSCRLFVEKRIQQLLHHFNLK